MRVAAAISFGLFTVGVVMTWATDVVVFGAIVTLVGAIGLFVVVLFSASRDASAEGGDPDRLAPVQEQNERLFVRWRRS